MFSSRRVMCAERYTRGNTNVVRLQPIDEASWLKLADSPFSRFRCEFEVGKDDGPLRFDVSADERFLLTLDGAFVARGPHRGTVEHWLYQSYEIDKLAPGRHVLEATVWRLGDYAPRAQLSWQGGFVLKAAGVFDARLTTGRADWQVGELGGIRPIEKGRVNFSLYPFEITGRGPYAAEPKEFRRAEVVRGPAGLPADAELYGGRTPGWMLFPSPLPDQLSRVIRPGTFRVTDGAGQEYVDRFNALLRGGSSEVVIPANTELRLAWCLDDYTCAYPQLETAGGKGARVAWGWAESPYSEGRPPRKGNRMELAGKRLRVNPDVFVCDGGKGSFSTPWFRCGLWCQLEIKTAAEPLTVTGLALEETRYPLSNESVFAAEGEGAEGLGDIRRICLRAQEMCAHEMLFDCPYYEQQMYPGDSRVQLEVLRSLSADDRLIRRVIELFALGARDNGLIPMNFPSRRLQESLTYTLAYLAMYGDYVMYHANREWLRARLPGFRHTMSGVAYYENAEGLLADLPGWNFMDWTVGWEMTGEAPGTKTPGQPNAEVNLCWLMAIEAAVTLERALGEELQAVYWERKADRLKAAIVGNFWDERRGMLADTPERRSFSEHAQALAILTDALDAGRSESAFAHLVADGDLGRCTVYFRYYLFAAFFKTGRGDLFLDRLSLWRDFAAKGLRTTMEEPETPTDEPRSDCHAWGAHPLVFMTRGLAGIRSAAPFFEKVLVAPCPGGLTAVRAVHPHPKGAIEVDLRFDGGEATGTVRTPVPGSFRFGGRGRPLEPGLNLISLSQQ